MSENPMLTDLRFAQQTGQHVEIHTYSLALKSSNLYEVHEVDPEGQWVSVLNPQTFGDKTTRKRIEVADIASVTVHDVQ